MLIRRDGRYLFVHLLVAHVDDALPLAVVQHAHAFEVHFDVQRDARLGLFLALAAVKGHGVDQDGGEPGKSVLFSAEEFLS